MSAALLTGSAAAATLIGAVRTRILALGRSPRLAVVRVAGDGESDRYLRALRRAAEPAGVTVLVHDLDAAGSFERFRLEIGRLAVALAPDGILIHKPVPEGRAVSEALEAVDPRRDVEGLHPENVGLLLLGRPRFVPCTAGAVIRLLDAHRVPLSGVRAVIVGRSDIVGKPLAALLLARHATVTICHRTTADLGAEVGRAELLVAAAGEPEVIRAEWIDPAAVVVDVGHHVLDDRRPVGDVERGAAARVAAITPVPGGVGPLTVAVLLANVAAAAEARG